MLFISEMFGQLLLLLSLCGIFFCVGRLGCVKSCFVPVVSLAGISLILFWGGIAGKLAMTAWILYYSGLAGGTAVLYLMVRRKLCFPAPGLFDICFGTITAVFAILIFNLRMDHYDNFSHWALIVKYLLTEGALPRRNSVLVPFRDYPPGSSLYIYFICRFGGRSEGVMLLAQNSIIFACFYAVFGIIREKRRFLLYAFLGMGCAFLSYLNLTVRINNLLVDFMLPLLAMSSVAVAYRYSEEIRKLCIMESVLLGFTVTVKSTGVFFAGAAGIFLLFFIIRSKKNREKIYRTIFCSVITAVCSSLPFFAWKYRLQTDLAGFQGKFELGNAGEKLAQYRPAAEKLYESIIHGFLRAAADPADRAFQVFVLGNLLSAAAVLFVRMRMKRRWRLGWILAAADIMTAAYYAGMLYMYLYTMPEAEAVRLAGFDRYSCSIMVLFAGALFMGATVDLENSFAVDIDEAGPYKAYSSPRAKRRYQYAVLAFFVAGINILYSEINGLITIRGEWEGSLSAQAEQLVGNNWYRKGGTDPKRYLVAASNTNGQVTNGEVRYVFRYYLWADNVDVTDRLEAGSLKQTEADYDCIIVLDPETVYGPVEVIGNIKYEGSGIYRIKG